MGIDTEPLIILESIDSTNNYAMGLLYRQAATHGYAVVAREQTAGKGRRGKGWKSNKDESILMSIIADTRHLSLHQQFRISLVAALGAFDFFSRFTNEKLKIKWPNDLYQADRKAGGILIENNIKGDLWQWSVIGIGININQVAFEDAENAISLKQITGKDYDVIRLAKQLRLDVMRRYDELKNGGFEKMLTDFNKHLFRLNEIVKLKKGNVVFETTIKGVSAQGELITMDAMERRFGFDEVEWLLNKK